MHDRDNTVAMWRRHVLVQVRRGRLTQAVFSAALEPFRRLGGAGQPVAGVALVEPSAPIPDDHTRKMQREILDEVMAHPTARMAAVLLGEDLPSQLQRSASRLVALGNPRIQRFHTLPAAVDWLVAEMAAMGFPLQAAELTAVVESVRALKPPP